ncbi:protein disulfide isomerase CRELD2 [Petaurus breviceps papuanus]|uniref:protein disulfide isomerase CRELD2 n=1 Tax=Petaurus breviceps papuanus TaxID=3040969 RepID=UPI0036D92EEE
MRPTGARGQSLWPLLALLLLPLPGARASSSSPPQSHKPCSVCKSLVEQFNKGLADTEKKNFGGGNTAWEEKTLSKYESSEIRLLEIVENLCESDAFDCNHMVESNEEYLEDWWFRQKKKHPDLFRWFCVETLEVCCLAGTYGPDCLECPGGSKQPCRGNGYCNGDGSRGGDGKCMCHLGYKGPLCMDCVEGYFSTWRNDTHSICTVCNAACKTCSGPTHRDCGECEVGWVQEDHACIGSPFLAWAALPVGLLATSVHPLGVTIGILAALQLWPDRPESRGPPPSSSWMLLAPAELAGGSQSPRTFQTSRSPPPRALPHLSY